MLGCFHFTCTGPVCELPRFPYYSFSFNCCSTFWPFREWKAARPFKPLFLRTHLPLGFAERSSHSAVWRPRQELSGVYLLSFSVSCLWVSSTLPGLPLFPSGTVNFFKAPGRVAFRFSSAASHDCSSFNWLSRATVLARSYVWRCPIGW